MFREEQTLDRARIRLERNNVLFVLETLDLFFQEVSSSSWPRTDQRRDKTCYI